MGIMLLLALAAGAPQAEAKVREAIAALEKALVAGDESVGDLIDLSRLLREMERRGTIPDSNTRFRGARRLEENLSSMTSGSGSLNGGWKRVEPLSVKITAGGDEAEALCRVTFGTKKVKFRLWLGREGDSFKTFDLENLDGSYRLSVIGLGYAPGVHDDEDKQSLRDGVMAFQRGVLYLSKGQPEGTRDAMSMARRCTPPPYIMDWIDIVDGQALSALGDPAGALKAVDRALVRQKDLAVALHLKAACHAALNEPAKAIAAAKEYLQLVGDDAELWTLIGRACEQLDQADEAIDAYRKGADGDAADVVSRLELGRMLLSRRIGDAVPILAAAVRLDAAEYERAADLLDGAGAHAEVLALTEEAATRRADEAPLLHRRGRALRKLGRWKEAEETLVRASKIHLDEPAIPQELVLVLAQSGKDAAAMKAAPAGNAWSHAYVRAFVHAAAGRSAAAIGELKIVVRAEETLKTSLAWIDQEPVFEKLRGEALLGAARATRDYLQARRDPRHSSEDLLRIAGERLQAAPDHAVARLDQARAFRRLRRFEEAESSLRRAIEKSEDKSLFQDELGRTLAARGKLDEALDIAEALVRAKPGAEEPGMDLRVAVFAIAGKREAAIKALQTLLEKHPAWHAGAAAGEELDEFRRLPAVQELLRKARARTRKQP